MLSENLQLRADGVSYAYDGVEAVRDISLGVAPGQLLALAGPNGSGKTTLLKLLTGVRKPSAGQVTLDGAPISRLSRRAIARRVGAVSQHVDPSLAFSVRDIVAMGRTPHSGFFGSTTSEDLKATQSAMSATATDGLGDRRFGELSGGEQQRVMLAVALAQETQYLLLDEPTVHLDLYHQHELLELLQELRRERRIGIVAVMHDLNLAALYFDRMAILNSGRLIVDGPSHDVLLDNENLRVFRAPLRVITHPQTGAPQVLLERKL